MVQRADIAPIEHVGVGLEVVVAEGFLRLANEVLKAQERKIRLAKLKGELVDRAQACALVFDLARQERDAWQNWPPRVAANMAADLGIEAHAMEQALVRYVHQHLSEMAEVKIDLG